VCIHNQKAAYNVSALIESGVDCNFLSSYSSWEVLGKPQLTNVNMKFQSFTCAETPSLGKCFLKLSVQEKHSHVTFYAANKEQSLVDVVLGISWIRSTNSRLDWTLRQYNLIVNSTSLTGTSVLPQPSFQQVENENQKEAHEDVATKFGIVDTSAQANNGWQVLMSLLVGQGYGREESTSSQYWLPKVAYKALPHTFRQPISYKKKSQNNASSTLVQEQQSHANEPHKGGFQSNFFMLKAIIMVYQRSSSQADG